MPERRAKRMKSGEPLRVEMLITSVKESLHATSVGVMWYHTNCSRRSYFDSDHHTAVSHLNEPVCYWPLKESSGNRRRLSITQPGR